MVTGTHAPATYRVVADPDVVLLLQHPSAVDDLDHDPGTLIQA